MKTQNTHQPHLWALIPCAGNGSRAASRGPKQYERLLGKPLVQHTLEAFSRVPAIHGTLVVLAPQDEQFGSSVNLDDCHSVFTAHCGGVTRAQSVYNGLQYLLSQHAKPDDWVLVHDAARCLVTPQLIESLIVACVADAVGGLLALPLPDTLKSGLSARVAATLDRSDKWLAQTPQMFRTGALRDALALTGDYVTDESSAMEAMGLSPKLVMGSAQNFKVTFPQDFALARAVLRAHEDANHEQT